MFFNLPHTHRLNLWSTHFVFLPAPRYSLHIQFLSLTNGKMQPVTKGLQSFPPFSGPRASELVGSHLDSQHNFFSLR